MICRCMEISTGSFPMIRKNNEIVLNADETNLNLYHTNLQTWTTTNSGQIYVLNNEPEN